MVCFWFEERQGGLKGPWAAYYSQTNLAEQDKTLNGEVRNVHLSYEIRMGQDSSAGRRG